MLLIIKPLHVEYVKAEQGRQSVINVYREQSE